MMAVFKIGDKVQWTSQANAYTKTKHGIVVGIVGPCEPASQVACRLALYLRHKPGLFREHESYLVRVGKQESVYWPRVKHLQHEE
jgi:hypothetical protein